jgi:glutaredoxin-like protein NrdH
MDVKKYAKSVPGKKADILMFTLSTCVWCMKTKKLLKDMGVEYNYIDVDLLDEKFLDEVQEEFRHWNPDMSFPTIIINKKNCVVGFREEEIRKLLNEK